MELFNTGNILLSLTHVSVCVLYSAFHISRTYSHIEFASLVIPYVDPYTTVFCVSQNVLLAKNSPCLKFSIGIIQLIKDLIFQSLPGSCQSFLVDSFSGSCRNASV
jgi:hypothetical protein